MAGYVQTAAITLPLWIGIHYLARLYDADIVGSGSDEYAQVLKAGAFGVVVMTTLSFWDRTVILSRGWILISWALSLFLIISGRALLRGLLLRGRQRGRYGAPGPDRRRRSARDGVAKQFAQSPSSGVKVLAFLDDFLSPDTEVMNGIRVWGAPAQLSEAVRTLDVDEVFIVSEALDWETCQDVMHELVSLPDHVRARLCPKLGELWTAGLKLSQKSDVAVLTWTGMRYYQPGRNAETPHGLPALSLSSCIHRAVLHVDRDPAALGGSCPHSGPA